MNPRPILYAEDEENDAFFFQRAFKAAEIANPVVVVSDGQEAIDYFEGNGAFANREKHPLPALVVLDLNLPLRSGTEVLSRIRQEPAFAEIPVIIFSSSLQPSDIDVAYAKGANAYLVKPSRPDELTSLARGIHKLWLSRSGA